MPDIHLFDNVVGPPTITSTGSSFELGVAFRTAQGLTVTGLRWYATSTTTTDKPTHLYLWDTVGASVIASIATPGHSGLVGWQTASLDTPVLLEADHEYRVSMGIPTGTHWAEITNAAAPPYPLVWATQVGYAGSIGGYPNTSQTNRAFWVDIVLDTDYAISPDPSPVLVGDVKEALRAWLDPGSADLPVGDSGLYPRVAGEMDAFLAGSPDNAETISGNVSETKDAVAGIAATINDEGTGLVAIAGDVAALRAKVTADGVTLDAKIGPLETYGSVGSKGVSAGVEIVRTTTIDEGAATRTQVGVTADVLREQLTLSPDLTDTSRWTLVGSTAGEGRGLVTDQADLYLLTLTAFGGLPTVDVAGVTWVPRWGWGVAPRVHGAYRQRQFHDYTPAAITADGLLMDGLLVNALPGVEWTVDAYVLDRTP